MNSSRNNNPSGRGRGDRGPRRRGGFNDRDRKLPSVPNAQQVFAGAAVSIVLKVDQPTGKEVDGVVSEVLTSGNHPRGIKVRLQDGRVGRVQRMVSDEEGKAGSEGLSGLERNGELSNDIGGARVHATPVGGFTNRRYGDYRVDAPDEPPTNELSLTDYIVVKPAKKGKGKKKQVAEEETFNEVSQNAETSTVESATTKCPVCGEFKGDEAAVAHHVSEHFD